MQDPSHVCNLYHSSWQQWILNLLNEARDQTYNLLVTRQIRFSCATEGTPNPSSLSVFHQVLVTYLVMSKTLTYHPQGTRFGGCRYDCRPAISREPGTKRSAITEVYAENCGCWASFVCPLSFTLLWPPEQTASADPLSSCCQACSANKRHQQDPGN